MPMASARKADLATSLAPSTKKIGQMGRRMGRTRHSEAAAIPNPHVNQSYQCFKYL